eukprot:12168629-Prorocentrum_lima.AAC.1
MWYPPGGGAPSEVASMVVHVVVSGAEEVGGAEAFPTAVALGTVCAVVLALATAGRGASRGSGA